jgi:hypothetical protein
MNLVELEKGKVPAGFIVSLVVFPNHSGVDEDRNRHHPNGNGC